MRWHDLGDDELVARLVNRGLHPDVASNLVRHRDEPHDAALIGDVLDG